MLPRVYPIVDTASLERSGFPALAFAEALLEGGAKLLQYRHKAPFTREVFAELAAVARACAAAGARLVVNDRADLALLVDGGVHVGQDDLTPVQVKRIVGARLVGYSTHNETQFTSAEAEAADYLAFGPVFPTASKENPDPVVGVELLSRLRRLSAKPLVAIGGITRETAAAVWSAGADSVAVIGDLLTPEMNKESIRRRFEEWNRLPR